MIRFFFIEIFLVILFSWSNVSLAEGGGSMTGGGGGNGVACFVNATVARQAVDSKMLLKPEFIDKIETLEVLDYWELSGEQKAFMPMNGETPQEMVRRILVQKWQTHLPQLTDKILDVFDLIANENFSSSTTKDRHVPAILDFGSVDREILENCRLIGIINRFAYSKPGLVPDLAFHKNALLFNKLITHNHLHNRDVGVLNQAMLLLHEMIYALSFEKGDRDSYESRALVRLLFSENTWSSLEAASPTQRRVIISTIEATFRSYQILSLFEKKYPPVSSQEKYSAVSRNRSWNTLVRKTNICMDQWRTQNSNQRSLSLGGSFLGSEQFMNQCLYRLGLSDEEAFLLAVHGFSLIGRVSSVDTIISTGEDGKATLETACDLIDSIPAPRSDYGRLTLEQSERYCEKLDL